MNLSDMVREAPKDTWEPTANGFDVACWWLAFEDATWASEWVLIGDKQRIYNRMGFISLPKTDDEL